MRSNVSIDPEHYIRLFREFFFFVQSSFQNISVEISQNKELPHSFCSFFKNYSIHKICHKTFQNSRIVCIVTYFY